MKILFFGDIFGKPGRNVVAKYLPLLKKEHNPDFIIANAENATHGRGLSKKHYLQLCSLGIDCFTMGNHTWDRNDIYSLLNQADNIIRPFNIDNSIIQGSCGVGTKIFKIKNKKVRVTNLLGNTVKMNFELRNIFLDTDDILNLNDQDIHIVDLHAETTSEKNSYACEYNGKIQAIFGTHTHVPTNDAHITNAKTFFITDVGMCGPGYLSSIGVNYEEIVKKFRNQNLFFKMDVSKQGYQLNAILLEFDDATNKPNFFKVIRYVKE